MTYSEQYYYYYKYPHYSTVVGVPVGIGLCVLVLCISVVCQKKRRARQQEEEEAALAEQAVAESAEYHAMDDVAAADDDDEPSNSRSSSPRSPSINIGNALDHLSRHEQIGGDWDGFARRESGSSSPDSVYFQVRGLMTVGAHRDRIGSYTIDGVIDASCNSVSFHKTYASSQTTVEYDCQLWQEPGEEMSLTVMTGTWAGRGASGSCVLFHKRKHKRVLQFLERLREEDASMLNHLGANIANVIHCTSYDELREILS